MSNELRINLRKAYDKTAQERDKRAIQGWKIEERGKFLSKLDQEGKKTLLEIGAGTGKDSLYFQEHGLEVVCIDLSPEMVKLCKQKGLSASIMDFGNLQIADETFDSIYALNCLLHLPKKEFPSVISSINSILKSGGLFYLGVYGGYDHEGVWEEDYCEPKRFFSFYSDEHLKRVLNEVFDILKFEQIKTGGADAELHFQSVMLRKR